MLCVSLTPATVDEIFRSDIQGADCVEVRLDYLNDPASSMSVSWTKVALPVVVACRRIERGGKFAGSAAEEREILEAAARNGAAFVDMDYRDAYPLRGARLIASFHDFEQTGADIAHRLAAAAAAPGEIAKVATMVRSWADNRRLLGLLNGGWRKPVIVSGMGEIGQIIRLVGPSRGSFLTYAMPEQQSGEPAAPGQMSVREMTEVFRFRKLSRDTRLLGVLGCPVRHSWSPLLHNQAFDATGLDCVYLKLNAPDAADFFENAAAIGIQGCSVTIPHKKAALVFVEHLSAIAKEVGAVNTLSWHEGSWAGDNTDVHGALAALASAGFSPAGKSVVILGSGGAARAAALAVRGARSVVVLSRSPEPAVEWPVPVTHDLAANAAAHPCDLLINATPVGMYPEVEAFPTGGAIPASAVFDMVYNPKTTRLLRNAADQGKTVISGTAMFVAQAARQFEIWTGQPAPPHIYRVETLWP